MEQKVLNLDMENYRDLYVGSAEGGETEVTLSLNNEMTEDDNADSCSLLELHVNWLMASSEKVDASFFGAEGQGGWGVMLRCR